MTPRPGPDPEVRVGERWDHGSGQTVTHHRPSWSVRVIGGEVGSATGSERKTGDETRGGRGGREESPGHV